MKAPQISALSGADIVRNTAGARTRTHSAIVFQFNGCESPISGSVSAGSADARPLKLLDQVRAQMRRLGMALR